jgi:putative membrane-bound dehydrogenase-like protein
MIHMFRWLRHGSFASVSLSLLLAWSVAADNKPGTAPAGPLSPKEELATLRVPKGLRIELVASEPDVVDPVAMAFDEDGRMFVAEMRGYPNGGLGTGTITSGQVRLLEDKSGDGHYQATRVYADGLRFPTGVMPWKGGLIVCNAPDILYFDESGRRRVLYTGFGVHNIQQLVNSPQWGLDNWVYAISAGNGGDITSPEKPDAPAVQLRNRGIRFHPETPGSLEPMSGGGQYGLSADDWQQYFTATNAQHLRHFVLPDHYLRRNPALAVSATTLDIPDHGPACLVHRISPFEAWRVERTTRRAQGPEAKRFPSTELVPGGYITSACSPVVYTADVFPTAFRNNSFVCDPANNLVHRDILEAKGATFVARRADADCEFLASTDTWFRPVHLTIGPDGALYVLDFYREAIETPLSLPDDIKAKMNLESRGRGRIWRVVPEGKVTRRRPALSKAKSSELARHLEDGNSWWRLTAQRLLIERQDKSVVKQLEDMSKQSKSPQGRAHALWTLHGLGALNDDLVQAALADTSAGVREQGLRLADGRLAASAKLQLAVAALLTDEAPRVRFQLAFTLGQADTPETISTLAALARRDLEDTWLQSAVLSSAGHSAPRLLEILTREPDFRDAAGPAQLQFLTRLAALVAARPEEAELARAVGLLATDARSSAWQVAILEGLGQGLQNTPRPLNKLWEHPPAGLADAVARAQVLFKRAAETAENSKAAAAERLTAIRLLGFGPFAVASKALPHLLSPQQPSAIQLASVRSLSQHNQSGVAEALLAGWSGHSPAVRREIVEALFSRANRLPALLSALEKNALQAGQLDLARVEQLRKHPDAKIRQRAAALLAGQQAGDRQKLVAQYRDALELRADSAHGKAVFKKVCATCHRLENEGTEVGPDLLSALRNKSRETLLNDILDPSREVDGRYINYQITTKTGRVFTGLIAAETATSVTLRRAEKAEDTILRNQIEEIQGTAKSVMPDGLEMQLSKQDLADVIGYLQAVGK